MIPRLEPSSSVYPEENMNMPTSTARKNHDGMLPLQAAPFMTQFVRLTRSPGKEARVEQAAPLRIRSKRNFGCQFLVGSFLTANKTGVKILKTALWTSSVVLRPEGELDGI